MNGRWPAFAAWAFMSAVLTASAEVDVNVTDFGAVANGMVDDAAAIQSALNFAGTNGGGVVRFPAARIKIGGRVTVPDKVDLLGAGMTATTITCSATASCIAFSDRQPHATVPQGGKSGNFFINGNGLATNPFYVGHLQGRVFERIKVLNALDVGLKIEEAQNSRFSALHVAQSGNMNVTIDLSSSVLGFYDCIFSGAGQHGVRIMQSGTPVNASGAHCSHLHFLGGLIEAIANGGAAVLIEAGTDIVIDAMGTSGSDIRIARAPNRVVQRITLRATELQAATAGVRKDVGLEVTGGASNDPIQVFVESGVYFRGGDYPIRTDDGALIHALNYYQPPGLTNLWLNLGGTKTIDQVVRDLGKRQSALTAASVSTVDSTYGAEESAVIGNVRSRLDEVDLRLKRTGLLGVQPAVAFTLSSAIAAEYGPIAAALSVQRTGLTSADLSISYAIDGTAGNGVDYATLSGSVTIPAGSATANIPIAPLPDTLAEGSETVVLTLAPNAAYDLAPANLPGTVIIQDKPFDSWRVLHFGVNANNPVIAAALADPDGDGAANLLEYALGLDPNAASVTPIASGFQSVGGVDYLRLTFPRVTDALDLTYTVQAADDLTNWLDGSSYSGTGSVPANAITTEVSRTGTNPETIVVRDNTAVNAAPKRFLRLRINETE